jgi:hypothetical protein
MHLNNIEILLLAGYLKGYIYRYEFEWAIILQVRPLCQMIDDLTVEVVESYFTWFSFVADSTITVVS